MSGTPLAGRFGVVVFDFDGTLCDSIEVKTQAFHDLYIEDHGPQFADRVKAYHLANQGVSRYDKITHIERSFLGHDGDPVTVAAVAERFSRLVEEAVVAAPLFPGVGSYLASASRDHTLAVASATPTDELRRICKRKEIAHHFAAIEGSPRSKPEILADLASRFATSHDRMIMVGDQPSDASAAEQMQIRAALIAQPAPWNAAHATFASFVDAVAWLEDQP